METILLVDDDNVNHIFARRILRGHVDLVSAFSGEEALSLMRREPFDLVLMDIVMPGKNGLQVYREMLADEVLKDTPLIFITAKEDDALEAECRATGATGYVRKPFSPEDLLQKVSDALSANGTA